MLVLLHTLEFRFVHYGLCFSAGFTFSLHPHGNAKLRYDQLCAFEPFLAVNCMLVLISRWCNWECLKYPQPVK
uniref:Uncharacterized protein n=1 Tax=Arundo donax TaxID=35708 RepID=A0A0A8YSA7_ARUDO